MRVYKERNNLEEIDALIHERIYGLTTYKQDASVRDWQGLIPKYSSDFSLAMSVAEKVGLFDTIMLAKDRENWITLEASVSSLNETQSQKFYSSGLDIKAKAFSSGFTAAEAVARACLVLKVKENEQSSRSDQQSLGVL